METVKRREKEKEETGTRKMKELFKNLMVGRNRDFEEEKAREEEEKGRNQRTVTANKCTKKSVMQVQSYCFAY